MDRTEFEEYLDREAPRIWSECKWRELYRDHWWKMYFWSNAPMWR